MDDSQRHEAERAFYSLVEIWKKMSSKSVRLKDSLPPDITERLIVLRRDIEQLKQKMADSRPADAESVEEVISRDFDQLDSKAQRFFRQTERMKAEIRAVQEKMIAMRNDALRKNANKNQEGVLKGELDREDAKSRMAKIAKNAAQQKKLKAQVKKHKWVKM